MARARGVTGCGLGGALIVSTTELEVTMAVPTNAQLDTGAGQPSEDVGWTGWSRRWPVWIPYAAAVWGLLFAAIQVTWAPTGMTVPWSPDVAYAPAVLLFLAALAVAAAGACLATGRPLAGRGRVAVAASLILTVPVFVMGMAGLPAYVVTPTSFSGMESATGLVHTLLSAVGLSVYGVALLVYAPLSAAGVLPRMEASGAFTTGSGVTWMVALGGLAFGGLGFGLVAAARSYAARTRPVCARAATPAAATP